jgi:preprotein translocase subunit SecG
MELILLIVHLFLAMALVGVILLQKSEGGALGMGGGGAGSFLSARGAANLLTRTTAILAGCFFATSLVLSILAGWGRAPTTIIQGGGSAPVQAPGSAPAPLGSGGGILNQLQPQQPAAPSGPQVPRSQ